MSPNVSIALGLIRRAQAELRGLKLSALEQATLETQVEELAEIIGPTARPKEPELFQ